MVSGCRPPSGVALVFGGMTLTATTLRCQWDNEGGLRVDYRAALSPSADCCHLTRPQSEPDVGKVRLHCQAGDDAPTQVDLDLAGVRADVVVRSRASEVHHRGVGHGRLDWVPGDEGNGSLVLLGSATVDRGWLDATGGSGLFDVLLEVTNGSTESVPLSMQLRPVAALIDSQPAVAFSDSDGHLTIDTTEGVMPVFAAVGLDPGRLRAVRRDLVLPVPELCIVGPVLFRGCAETPQWRTDAFVRRTDVGAELVIRRPGAPLDGARLRFGDLPSPVLWGPEADLAWNAEGDGLGLGRLISSFAARKARLTREIGRRLPGLLR